MVFAMAGLTCHLILRHLVAENEDIVWKMAKKKQKKTLDLYFIELIRNCTKKSYCDFIASPLDNIFLVVLRFREGAFIHLFHT